MKRFIHPNKLKNINIAIFFILLIACSGPNKEKKSFQADFNNTNNRIWIGKDFWSIPVEDWKVSNGRVESVGVIPGSRVNLLTYTLSPNDGNFKLSAKMGLIQKGNIPGSAGFLVGIYDPIDSSAKAACYYGKGIKAGVSLTGFAFLKDKQVKLPEDFDWDAFTVSVSGDGHSLSLKITDDKGKSPEIIRCDADSLKGLVALATNLKPGNESPGKSTFWFDSLELSGSKVTERPDNAFGPVLWTMYTLNKGKVKLEAFLPPIGKDDNQEVNLQLNKDGQWETVKTEAIEPDSRAAIFIMDKWDSSKDVGFRVEYTEKGKDGTGKESYYLGTIRRDPVDRPLKVAGMTGQNWNGYPYSPLIINMTYLNPDLLFFSGDQIYEENGGYPIIRKPVERSMVNYLGKYYMFGWAFGNLMRDRPTVCCPDDHDIDQGNIWGEGGKPMTDTLELGSVGGFIQPTRMINMINRIQGGNLPDPYDPTPIDDGMSVWYTDFTYGRVSFALVSDRIFKSGPENIAFWKGRKDHLTIPASPSKLEKPGLKLLGDRQIKFLKDWITDWYGADMKVLLSQTIFANVATNHGPKMEYLRGDLDSGGWPKNGRDKAIKIMRKGFVFHIAGDQHTASLVQYGLDNYKDADWCFCVPAVSTGYPRAFLPDELGWKVKERPDHGLPNTGEYEDAFGNKNFIYAYGNPDKQLNWKNRYIQADKRGSGFGLVTLDQKSRDIKIDCWKFMANAKYPHKNDQIPGWPVTINQMDNYGRKAVAYLPEIKVNKPNQVIQVINNKGELVYVVRMKEDSFKPKVFQKGIYSIIVGEGNSKKEIKGISTESKNPVLVEI